MATQKPDHLALNAAVHKILSGSPDGWLEAAQTVVDAARGLPANARMRIRRVRTLDGPAEVHYEFQHESSGHYMLVRRGNAIEIASKAYDPTLPSHESHGVFFDSTGTAHTVAVVRFEQVPPTISARGLRVGDAVTNFVGFFATLLLFLVSFGTVPVSYRQRRIRRTFTASMVTVVHTTTRFEIGATVPIEILDEDRVPGD